MEHLNKPEEIKLASKLERIKEIQDRCGKLEKKYSKLADRAKSAKEIQRRYEYQTLYRDFKWRCFRLASLLQSPRVFGVPSYLVSISYDIYKEQELARKKKGKEKFESMYRIDLWFFQDSLSADYGTFSCDCCGSTFYHSPRAVSQGMNKLHDCVCGYCIERRYQ